MNKIFLYILLGIVSVGFVSCTNEEDDLFSKSAADRLNEMSEIYTQRLTAHSAGWAMQYYPTYDDDDVKGVGYLLLADFNKNMSVRVAMQNIFCNPQNSYNEASSAWEVIHDNGPVLSFNTWNDCLHKFSNPERFINGIEVDDKSGTGIGGDYEFIVVEAPEDASYIMLKGKKRGTYSLLTPLEDDTDFRTYLQECADIKEVIFPATTPNYTVMDIKGTKYEVHDASAGIATVYPLGSDPILYANYHPFLFTKRGGSYYMRFRDEFTTPNNEVAQDFRYDADKDIFFGVDANGGDIQDVTISSQYPSAKAFVKEQFEGGHRFALPRSASMSQKMRDAFNKAHSEFKSRKNTDGLDTLFLNKTEAGATWSFKKASSEKDFKVYNYSINETETGYAYNYTGPAGNQETTHLNTFPGLVPLLTDYLSREFIISPAVTLFDLSWVKFTAVDDPDLWFTILY